jgi:hypothetical protein
LIIQDIKRATRKHYLSEEKILIAMEGLRREDSIAELCHRQCNTHRIATTHLVQHSTPSSISLVHIYSGIKMKHRLLEVLHWALNVASTCALFLSSRLFPCFTLMALSKKLLA